MSADRSSDATTDWRSDPAKNRRSVAAILALLILATVAVYWPALRGEFVWDDLFLIKKNPLVTGEVTFRTLWFSQDFPLATTLFWIEWLLWGTKPLGYHIINLSFHVINAWLMWRLLIRLKIPGAALAAILWLFHPVCVASAAWISETKNTLSP